MNRIESFVYQHVKNNYIVKNLLRNIYQGFYDLLPDYESRFINEPIVREGYFYGFHDTTPFSHDNSMLLCNRLTIPLRMPSVGDVLEVGVLKENEFNEWHKIGDTTAWNYHKGCRLQWIGSGEHCIFNIADNGILKSRICDIDGRELSIINWPIDTVSHDGCKATGFSYGRLQQNMPGYGYTLGDADSYLDDDRPANTGLYLIDLEHNTRELLLSLEQLANFHPVEGMEHAMHFVTHTEFSADDRYIAFLHRWYRGTFRRTRLVVYDRQTGKIHLSPTTGMVSHYAWNNVNGIIAYCRVEDIDSHVYFSEPEMKEWKRCGYPQLNSDGHHHFIDDDTFVVDTYPDRHRHVKLYKVGITTGEVSLLADMKSPKRFVSPDEQHHWKCDLHPRCSLDGTMVSFDSVHTGKRAVCVMKL